MFKKLIITACTLIITTTAFAEHCPSINEVKQGRFHGWEAYDNDNGSPLDEKHMASFKKDIAQFYSIRWLYGAFEGESHCYYYGHHGYTYAFLSKPGLVPDTSSPNWVVEDDEPRCYAGIGGCQFLKA